jgi:hypothetical protein
MRRFEFSLQGAERKASTFPRVRLVGTGLWSATSGISVLWARVSGAGLGPLYFNFRFGTAETGSSGCKDRFAPCPSSIGRAPRAWPQPQTARLLGVSALRIRLGGPGAQRNIYNRETFIRKDLRLPVMERVNRITASGKTTNRLQSCRCEASPILRSCSAHE